MKLRSYAAIVLGSAVIVSNLPAIAQMAPELPTADVTAPKAEPKADVLKPEGAGNPATSVPATTPIAPTTAPEVAPVDAPEATVPMPEPESTKPQAQPLPTLKGTSTPPTSSPAANTASSNNPTVMTPVLPEESITGVKRVSLPDPSPIPAGDFTLPIALKVVKDVNLISSTPITDRYTSKENWNIAAWSAAIRNCLQQKPKLVRVVGDQTVPFMLNGVEGTIVLNANNKPVCPL